MMPGGCCQLSSYVLPTVVQPAAAGARIIACILAPFIRPFLSYYLLFLQVSFSMPPSRKASEEQDG